jgi:hypothetical protein
MASNTSEHDRLTETSDEVHNRSERTTQKPPKRQFRSDSPPALRPFRHKPWKTIFLVQSSNQLDILLVVCGAIVRECRHRTDFRKGNRRDLPLFLLGNSM